MLISILIAVGVAVAFFLFLWWRIRIAKNLHRSLSMVFLKVMIPIKDSKDDKEKDNEMFSTGRTFKEVTDTMTHFFEALHGAYKDDYKYLIFGQDFFSCEYVILDGLLHFYLVIPEAVQSMVEKQITAFYPDASIETTEDYNIFREGYKVDGMYIRLRGPSMYPVKTYQFLGTDPFNNLVNSFSKIAPDEGAAIQIMLRPLPDGWQKKGRKRAQDLFLGKEKEHTWIDKINVFGWVATLIRIMFQGTDSEKFTENIDANKGSTRTTPLMDEQVKLMETKNVKVGFEAVIRIIASARAKYRAHEIVYDIKDAFAQYNAPNNNAFIKTKYFFRNTLIRDFILRNIKRDWFQRIIHPYKMILCSEEISSVFHFPNIKYNRAPLIRWQEFKLAAGPTNMPREGLLLGTNVFRGEKKDVRILPDDRRRHFYIIGKSGTGKSTILLGMLKQDLKDGKGLCLVDPHGDLVEAILPHIPRSRADDVIMFDPGDLERPMGLNILEGNTMDELEYMSQEALSIFIKMFGEEIMGPRLQHYFRNGCLTLMEDKEEGATLIDLPRLFTDESWQRYKAHKVKNPIVKAFWDKEMAMTGAREKQEMIPYFSAKFGPFVTNAQIRNIIGQTKSSFDFRKVMDEGKILLCNLSKGKLGDLNSQLLGMVMVAKIQMAAMSRVDTPEDERRDFFLYVDEFQNFVTDSFASILSEARKYRLDLVIAHQYIAQITKMKDGGKGSHEDNTIRDAVFGNVGSMMCFRIGAQDAEYMAKEFAPVFSDQDLVNIANYQAYIKLSIKNATSRGFSMTTIFDPSKGDVQAAEAYRQLSRLKHARERPFVEREIFRRVGAVTEAINKAAQSIGAQPVATPPPPPQSGTPPLAS
ncbi:type IV secretion system DNA-binding domain-containing protein [Candidatus Peregrinibacteria bacterium]|nr:type IV secretion system DNA-binding domain-containing protein [Candidatus Peregrinibacteria bacterium]